MNNQRTITYTCPACGDTDHEVEIPDGKYFYLWTFCPACCEILVMLSGRDSVFRLPTQEELLIMPKDLKEEMRMLIILAANFLDRLKEEDSDK